MKRRWNRRLRPCTRAPPQPLLGIQAARALLLPGPESSPEHVGGLLERRGAAAEPGHSQRAAAPTPRTARAARGAPTRTAAACCRIRRRRRPKGRRRSRRGAARRAARVRSRSSAAPPLPPCLAPQSRRTARRGSCRGWEGQPVDRARVRHRWGQGRLSRSPEPAQSWCKGLAQIVLRASAEPAQSWLTCRAGRSLPRHSCRPSRVARRHLGTKRLQAGYIGCRLGTEGCRLSPVAAARAATSGAKKSRSPHSAAAAASAGAKPQPRICSGCMVARSLSALCGALWG